MRTTITFDDDTAAAVEHFRRERGLGLSAAVNELVRRATARQEPTGRFVQRTSAAHATMDLTNIGEVLEILDGPRAG